MKDKQVPYQLSPVIELSSLAPRPRPCLGCGREDKEVQQFVMRISPTQGQTMAWCKECSEKVALFLIRAWED